MKDIYQHIQNLLYYGRENDLFRQEDLIYVRNRVLSLLGLDEWEECHHTDPLPSLVEILTNLLDWAHDQGLLTSNTVTERDILDTEIMNCLMPRPSEVIRQFKNQYENHPELATKFFYKISTASNYIRLDRIAKNKEWQVTTPYGDIDITINLSKPEKDPKEIAEMREAPSSSYPTCLLCIENEGYKGTLRHPARATHRTIPIRLHDEEWRFQYSPYVYYKEHSIIFREEHTPMKMSRATFDRLLDFVDQFPHYFIGSNADLPIVGGSILSHDHFQGGKYTFAVEKAEMVETISLDAYPSTRVGIVNWPMSVIRIQGGKEDVANVAEHIYESWKKYVDLEANIVAYTGNTLHNTVTPIARRRGNLYEMDIVLRNNRTTEQYPDGIFHPHRDLHHIKKENIGLIEVMGLAVLPGRLATELEQIADYLVKPIQKEKWNKELLKHWEWYEDMCQRLDRITKENVMVILKEEVGMKFQRVLEDAGVFKTTEEGKRAFTTFLNSL
ncbi:UDP-glucose--hexose-1-phosphate uridylyltransferase [Peribacillus huizhouensis]|uniref:Galactose-1-phosphate uridylyltransferase n=1 Tax=Peribacillus huizhouensis TaxID=1501239 RepID=A0ABR6CUK2_9BACI|nr:UDP-glucose--hexose-1-phosphate uridylyltransferase [Peribacillus huizhouensis]MBA9028711.1 UDPglucose--hexose-1-phosphate uridylyltransferase [Peribacillus huizhouensis]